MENNKINIQNLDIQNLDLPNLIRKNQYFQYISSIKSYEDTLQKVFSSSKESHLISNPFVFLWKIHNNKNTDLFPDFHELDLNIFNIKLNENFSNVVFTGPYVRSCFILKSDNNIKKELYLYRFDTKLQWNEMLDLSIFTEHKDEYVYIQDDKKIYLIKKHYKSPAHIILQNDYIKRIGWIYHNNHGSFYTSSVFLIEFQKHINLLKSSFKDPIMNIPYDPLDIYNTTTNELTPIKIIDMVDYNELVKLPLKIFNKLYDSKTCIEYCLDKFIKEDHILLSNQLKQMIIYMCNLHDFKYKRPPYLYGKILGLDYSLPSLYKILKSVSCNYELPDNFDEICSIQPITNIQNINVAILENIISKDHTTINLDNPESKESKNNFFLDFLDFSKQKINKNILNLLIKYNDQSISICELLVTEKMIEKHQVYYLTLFTENLELIKKYDGVFDINIGLNYLGDILEQGKTRSFYFLYYECQLQNENILDTTFEQCKNLLHKIKPNGNYLELVKLLLKLKPELLNLHDENKETPVLYHAKEHPILLELFVKYDFDITNTNDDGNTLLHNLCNNKSVNIDNSILKMFIELIDMPNKKGETPIIICCQNNNEDLFYILKGMGANLNIQDYYGNTCYHYICSNGMCIGMMIENISNYFGIKPYDYCKISQSYYHFV